jgi:hypothetical protein
LYMGNAGGTGEPPRFIKPSRAAGACPHPAARG